MRLALILLISIGSRFVLALMRIYIQKKSTIIKVRTNLIGIETNSELTQGHERMITKSEQVVVGGYMALYLSVLLSDR